MRARRRGVTLDTALISANFILEAVFFTLLVGRRVYRTLPVFVSNQAYTLLFTLASLACSYSTPHYLRVWSVGITIDTLFYLCVLLELGKAVLRYNRASPPPRGLVFLLFLSAILPIGLLAQWPNPPRLDAIWQLEFRVMQASAVLEVAALLTLAWWSGLRKLRWPERELSLVMGMGSWALVQLCVLLLHEHGFIGPSYHWLDQLTPATVLGVFIYWLHYFWLGPGSAEQPSREDSTAAVAGRLD